MSTRGATTTLLCLLLLGGTACDRKSPGIQRKSGRERREPAGEGKPRKEARKSAEEDRRRKEREAAARSRIGALIDKGDLEGALQAIANARGLLPEEERAALEESVLRTLAQREFDAIEAEVDERISEGDMDGATALLKKHEQASNPYLAERVQDKLDKMERLRRLRAAGKRTIADVEIDLVLSDVRRLLDNRQPEAALKKLAELLYLNPDHVQARLLLVRCQLARKKRDAARKALDAFLKENPEHEEGLRLRLELAQDDKDTEKVEKIAGRLIGKHPNDFGLRLMRARARLQRDRPDEALEDIDFVLHADPDHEEALRIKIDLLGRRGASDQLLDLLGRWIEKHPTDAEAILRRARLHLERGELELAEKDFKKVLALRPGHREAERQIEALKKRDQGPVRPYALTPSIRPLFDGKSVLGWIPNESIRTSVSRGTLRLSSAGAPIEMQRHDLEFGPTYKVHVALETSANFHGLRPNGEVRELVGIALGWKASKPFYLLHLSGNHIGIDLCRGNLQDRTPIAVESLQGFRLDRWQMLTFEVRDGMLRVAVGGRELLPDTRLSGADPAGHFGVVVKTKAELRLRWLDVDGPLATREEEARPGLHFDPRSRDWRRKGDWHFGEGWAEARPREGRRGNLVTIQHRVPASQKYELDVDLSAEIPGPGYALIFFQAFGEACALGIGRDNQRREVLAVGQMGNLGRYGLFYNNNDFFVPRPPGVTFGTTNRYRIIVLDASVEIYIGEKRVFRRSKSAFLDGLKLATRRMHDYARRVRRSFRTENFKLGFGAWDASQKDRQRVRARFFDFKLKPIE